MFELIEGGTSVPLVAETVDRLRGLVVNLPVPDDRGRARAVQRGRRYRLPNYVDPPVWPFALARIEPDRITRFTGRRYPVWETRWRDVGKVRGGDWDRRDRPPVRRAQPQAVCGPAGERRDRSPRRLILSDSLPMFPQIDASSWMFCAVVSVTSTSVTNLVNGGSSGMRCLEAVDSTGIEPRASYTGPYHIVLDRTRS